MTTAIDTNILLDVLIPNQKHLALSVKKLEKAARGGRLIVSEIVYTELGAHFARESQVESFLTDTRIQVVLSDTRALFSASQLWQSYRQKRAQNPPGYCPECGKTAHLQCSLCGAILDGPRRVLNDFIIGAHAFAFADKLLTRDRGFYRKYFSGLTIV